MSEGTFLTSINYMTTMIKNNKSYFKKNCMCIFTRLNRWLSCFMGKLAQIAQCHDLNKKAFKMSYENIKCIIYSYLMMKLIC